MKKRATVNLFPSLVVLALVWFPPTRIFWTDTRFGTSITSLCSFLLFITALVSYSKDKQKIDILSLVISFSPIIFILVALGSLFFGGSFAP